MAAACCLVAAAAERLGSAGGLDGLLAWQRRLACDVGDDVCVVSEQGGGALAHPLGDLHDRVLAFVDQQAREAVAQVIVNGAVVGPLGLRLPSLTIVVLVIVARPTASHAGCQTRERQSRQSWSCQGAPSVLAKIKPPVRPPASS